MIAASTLKSCIEWRWGSQKFNYELKIGSETYSIVSCSTGDTSSRDLCIMTLPLANHRCVGAFLFLLKKVYQIRNNLASYWTFFWKGQTRLGTIQILRNQKGGWVVGWVRPNTYFCLHSGWVGVARCLRNQKMHDIKIKNIFLYYILHLEVALTSEVNMASKVNVILKGQELRVENHKVFFLMWSEKKMSAVGGFWKNYVIFNICISLVGHRKWLRLLTRWVGGVKKAKNMLT